eukprot:208149-Chlamydomonas_euryale.AAC.2
MPFSILSPSGSGRVPGPPPFHHHAPFRCCSFSDSRMSDMSSKTPSSTHAACCCPTHCFHTLTWCRRLLISAWCGHMAAAMAAGTRLRAWHGRALAGGEGAAAATNCVCARAVWIAARTQTYTSAGCKICINLSELCVSAAAHGTKLLTAQCARRQTP